MSQAVTTRPCVRCGAVLPYSEFAKDRRSPTGHGSRCKRCEAARQREYDSRPENRERKALWQRDRYYRKADSGKRRSRYRATHAEPSAWDRDPVKEAARRKFRQAVRAGRLAKPETCEDCGSKSPLHGHHEDYSKPLEVAWVCQPCHSKRHRKYGDEPTPSDDDPIAVPRWLLRKIAVDVGELGMTDMQSALLGLAAAPAQGVR